MKKEVIDGTAVYSGLFTEGDAAWNICVRAGGSISLYATRPGDSCHYVIFDTLDEEAPGVTAQRVITRLAEVAEGINLLLAAASAPPRHRGGSDRRELTREG